MNLHKNSLIVCLLTSMSISLFASEMYESAPIVVVANPAAACRTPFTPISSENAFRKPSSSPSENQTTKPSLLTLALANMSRSTSPQAAPTRNSISTQKISNSGNPEPARPLVQGAIAVPVKQSPFENLEFLLGQVRLNPEEIENARATLRQMARTHNRQVRKALSEEQKA